MPRPDAIPEYLRRIEATATLLDDAEFTDDEQDAEEGSYWDTWDELAPELSGDDDDDELEGRWGIDIPKPVDWRRRYMALKKRHIKLLRKIRRKTRRRT